MFEITYRKRVFNTTYRKDFFFIKYCQQNLYDTIVNIRSKNSCKNFLYNTLVNSKSFSVNNRILFFRTRLHITDCKYSLFIITKKKKTRCSLFVTNLCFHGNRINLFYLFNNYKFMIFGTLILFGSEFLYKRLKFEQYIINYC